MYTNKLQQKTGVFSPVTGQAVVVQTTCVDDSHADEIRREYKKDKNNRYKLPNDDLPRRVESHLLALKKKGRSRWVKGSGADLKIFTMLNGMKKEDMKNLTHVGIVQTAINPNDKTKPQGFRTNATRIGGTGSMINTGPLAIPPNSCVYWDFPDVDREGTLSEAVTSAQSIRGHPEGAVYPVIKVYDVKSEAKAISDRAVTLPVEEAALKVLQKQQRIIGWSTNHAEPGCQLDVILKR